MIWYNTDRKFISYSKQLNLGSTLLSFSKQYSPRTKICTQQNTFYKRLPNYTTLMDGSYSLYMQFVSYKFQLPMILFNGFFIFMHGLFVLDWIIPRMGLGREIELRVFYTQRVITKNVGIIIRRPFWVKKIAFSLPLGWNIKFWFE